MYTFELNEIIDWYLKLANQNSLKIFLLNTNQYSDWISVNSSEKVNISNEIYLNYKDKTTDIINQNILFFHPELINSPYLQNTVNFRNTESDSVFKTTDLNFSYQQNINIGWKKNESAQEISIFDITNNLLIYRNINYADTIINSQIIGSKLTKGKYLLELKITNERESKSGKIFFTIDEPESNDSYELFFLNEKIELPDIRGSSLNFTVRNNKNEILFRASNANITILHNYINRKLKKGYYSIELNTEKSSATHIKIQIIFDDSDFKKIRQNDWFHITAK